jgi:hypothetical protein
MKVILKKICFKVKDYYHLKMVIYIKEILKMGFIMEKESILLVKKGLIKGFFVMGCMMGKEFLSGKMIIIIKESIRKE